LFLIGNCYIFAAWSKTNAIELFLASSIDKRSAADNGDTRVDSLHVEATFQIELGFGNLLLYRFFLSAFLFAQACASRKGSLSGG
jgi:hypothetical protein